MEYTHVRLRPEKCTKRYRYSTLETPRKSVIKNSNIHINLIEEVKGDEIKKPYDDEDDDDDDNSNNSSRNRSKKNNCHLEGFERQLVKDFSSTKAVG
ncbi:hypothetical protein RUM43_009135 [Polyplax serrata]|uniref:Uncharacterized protein n=1 Tax=Polyplax serrata TaxID=468196 RepID=A0AAN8S1V6_POLSC